MADETSASGAKLGNSVASPPTHPAKAPMSQPSSNHTPATSTSSEGPRPAPTVSFDPSTKSKERATGVDGSASSRRSSVSSIRFSDAPRHPELPRRGNRTQFDHRHRAASPPAKRFNSHVAFETTAHTELNKGPAGITLNEKHNGFRHERRAKTFMVGVDENSYSVEALEWLLTSMVDDHDTVVCVRVIDKDIKHNMKNAYLAEAKRFMHDILQTNTSNKAISVVVEYQFGRLGQTFENLVTVHQPSMLVVGTKGKSKQGMQGVWNTRNSFSKYCLEKSAVPVVVVRPKDVREKKKSKRAKDPTRTTYAQMLAASNGVHESDFLDDEAVLEKATQLSSMEEASLVAKALSLPAEYDPTIKAYRRSVYGQSKRTSMASTLAPNDAEPTPSSTGNRKASSTQGDSSEEEDGGLEGFDGQGKRLVDDPNKKAKLHNMEVSEAAALRRRNTNDPEEDDD